MTAFKSTNARRAALIRWAGHVRMADRIIQALGTAGKHGLTSYELAEVVYADDETGGPVDVSNVLCVHIFGLRRTLWPHGATIRSEKGRNARHRLEMLQCDKGA